MQSLFSCISTSLPSLGAYLGIDLFFWVSLALCRQVTLGQTTAVLAGPVRGKKKEEGECCQVLTWLFFIQEDEKQQVLQNMSCIAIPSKTGLFFPRSAASPFLSFLWPFLSSAIDWRSILTFFFIASDFPRSHPACTCLFFLSAYSVWIVLQCRAQLYHCPIVTTFFLFLPFFNQSILSFSSSIQPAEG